MSGMYARVLCMHVRIRPSTVKACVCGKERRDKPIDVCPSSTPVPNLPSPSLPLQMGGGWVPRTHARTAHAVRLHPVVSRSYHTCVIVVRFGRSVCEPHDRPSCCEAAAACGLLYLLSFSLLPGLQPQLRTSLMSPCGRNLSKADDLILLRYYSPAPLSTIGSCLPADIVARHQNNGLDALMLQARFTPRGETQSCKTPRD